MKRRIREEWDGFARAVMPGDAPLIQVEEMRKAFYAGSLCMFATLAGGVSAGAGEPTPADLAMMDELAAELKEYEKSLEVEA